MEKSKGMMPIGGRKIKVYEIENSSNYTIYENVKEIEVLTVNDRLFWRLHMRDKATATFLMKEWNIDCR